MKALRQQLALAAPTNGRVLIFGESGTGKELVAHALHLLSLRAQQPFVEVNCAAIPEELIESELFGHVKGSFTGAVEDKVGKFEQAHGGTLFLDEVGDMSLRTQSKVLRVIEEQRFTPVGSGNNLTVDVRVVAATNKTSGGGDPERQFPRGPLLPPQRHSLFRSSAARARGRYSRPGRLLPGGVRPRLRPPAQALLRIRPGSYSGVPLAGQRARIAQPCWSAW